MGKNACFFEPNCEHFGRWIWNCSSNWASTSFCDEGGDLDPQLGFFGDGAFDMWTSSIPPLSMNFAPIIVRGNKIKFLIIFIGMFQKREWWSDRLIVGDGSKEGLWYRRFIFEIHPNEIFIYFDVNVTPSLIKKSWSYTRLSLDNN